MEKKAFRKAVVERYDQTFPATAETSPRNFEGKKIAISALSPRPPENPQLVSVKSPSSQAHRKLTSALKLDQVTPELAA